MRNKKNAAALLGVAALAVASLAVPTRAQDAKKEAIKPAPTPSQAVLEAWNDIGRKLIAMAEDFPEDKYDFKPTPAQRSFAEQLLHAANANYFFTNLAMGEKPPAEEDPKRDLYKTKADVA
ncbi:MAG: DinB family protein, partial [Candidatus Sulfotelmatobacter sp.]